MRKWAIVILSIVKVAVGFLGDIDNNSANDWIVDFSEKLKDGKTVKQACYELKDSYNGTGLEDCIICGNTATKLS